MSYAQASREGSGMDRGEEGRRATKLSALDLELWSAVTADIKPFRDPPAKPKPPSPAPPPAARSADVVTAPRHAPSPQKRADPPMTLDETTRRKLKRGRLDVDVK